MSRGRVIFLVCLAAACYFIYTAASGAVRSHRIASDERAARQEVEQLREKKAYLQAVLQYVASDQYVEQEARRRLGYAREGEVPLVILSPALPEQPAQGGEWWERLFPR